jgi:hypothetical protein
MTLIRKDEASDLPRHTFKCQVVLQGSGVFLVTCLVGRFDGRAITGLRCASFGKPIIVDNGALLLARMIRQQVTETMKMKPGRSLQNVSKKYYVYIVVPSEVNLCLYSQLVAFDRQSRSIDCASMHTP